mmetsp:Transcript_26074/g.64586  ORF Transcript_26074/g.64586 Transcript_26074/m.64586 type:complete len:248 (+) Transcript_26074:140-883(+)
MDLHHHVDVLPGGQPDLQPRQQPRRRHLGRWRPHVGDLLIPRGRRDHFHWAGAAEGGAQHHQEDRGEQREASGVHQDQDVVARHPADHRRRDWELCGVRRRKHPGISRHRGRMRRRRRQPRHRHHLPGRALPQARRDRRVARRVRRAPRRLHGAISRDQADCGALLLAAGTAACHRDVCRLRGADGLSLLHLPSLRPHPRHLLPRTLLADRLLHRHGVQSRLHLRQPLDSRHLRRPLLGPDRRPDQQ